MTTCSEGTVLKAAVSTFIPALVDVHTHGNDTYVSGILGKLLMIVLNSCCDSLDISREVRQQEDLYMSLSDEENIVLPYTQVHSFQYQIDNTSFLPVLSSPGAVFLVDIEHESVSGELTQILAVTWQLLCIILISCGIAAIIIWILDTVQNPETFPRSFHQGLWEGLWWAFVSMTTVGYGDLTPKSILGRLFAMVWILVGICIFSVFTATLTAALTFVDESKNTISGRKVGVLNGTEDFKLAMLLGANPIAYNSMDNLLHGIQDDDDEPLQGILIDNAYVTDEIMSQTVLRVLQQVSSHRVHGILLQNMKHELFQCFQKAARQHMHDNNIMTSDNGGGRKKTLGKVEGYETMSNWLSIKSMYIGIYASILVALVSALLIWEFVFWKPKQKRMIGANKSASQDDKPHNNIRKLVF